MVLDSVWEGEGPYIQRPQERFDSVTSVKEPGNNSLIQCLECTPSYDKCLHLLHL